ncbi:MAG: hypothetical protein A3A98_00275 [Candidatus Staskawiczbacteria bacterium RIFCSPLOWO2_01_FULL_40_39]|uniref:Uncharacterized protein n=1 Tax=Candidatus Staskawiczbacteria bacterium RIFCSPHIGHO2_01_FULL_39_25 TaxID=1802202 RepID=A0A1G2HMF4_9BACT|nr:MAG: hypothetical protein A2730_00275 [Candidatus Staskawiczbacteria bacterium RIFCSPHIGHO2_01_FULL_39_25]OGZ73171.1 MAG: hypothetical protein A3A98_00275 [Candidatus Staskawiczbacteria bacterium RIFCSPLOWO2_01_FULL_40_39]OGZ75991.1 MAG: hypothetical protein A3I87_01455 [Candidatus Staskawiczbacteria bacterium RIFCSPLOWO2_02_FULL_39_8]
MPADAKEIQAKELLQRTNIRTMRKDLQQLREADVVKESEKIVAAKIAKEPVQKSSPAPESADKQIPPAQDKKIGVNAPEEREENLKVGQYEEKITYPISWPAPEPIRTVKDSGQKAAQEKVAKEPFPEIEHKAPATETEKQKIFLLTSQRAKLEHQLTIIAKEESPLVSEKNQLSLQQKDLQKKLNPLIEEEKKIEAEKTKIENREKENTIVAQRQYLEKERWKLEDQRQKIEKKRWPIEEHLAKLEEKIQDIDAKYEKITLEKGDLKTKIAEINSALKELNFSILPSEETAKQELMEKPKEHMPIEPSKLSRPAEKNTLKAVPPTVKEKFVQSTKIEEERRRKFMEDVERWASLSDKNNHDDSNNSRA